MRWKQELCFTAVTENLPKLQLSQRLKVISKRENPPRYLIQLIWIKGVM